MKNPNTKWVAKLAMMTLVASAPFVAAASGAPGTVPQVRLYALDCGHATFADMGMFSDTGEYDGKPGKIADPCFLIQHPKGVLLWDTGLGDQFAAHSEGVDVMPGIHVTVQETLVDQLKSLGLAPAAVTYVAFSHFHFDHTGNANEFIKSVWILNKNELSAALSA